MAGPERFELPTSSFEDLLSIQLNYGPINLAPGVGIEPTIAESKSVVLPLHYPGIKLVSLLGFEPRPHGPKPRMQPDNTLERY